MAEVARGHANFSLLALQGNYRAATAQDMAKSYSMYLTQRRIFVSSFAQKAFRNNASSWPLKDGPPVFTGDTNRNETGAFEIDPQGMKPHDWAAKILAIGKTAVIWKRGNRNGACLTREKLLAGEQNDPPGK